MYLSPTIKKELDYFRKLHEHYYFRVGNKEVTVPEVDDKILFMLFTASLVMDVSGDDFFESFKIIDKAKTIKNEMLIDAYAFIETENTREKQLHVFLFKLHESENKSASPKELDSFATLINNEFLHSELNAGMSYNEALKEMESEVNAFLGKRRGNRVVYKCHYITNAGGILPKDEKSFSFLNRFDYDKKLYGFDVQVYGIKEIEELAMFGKIQIEEEILNIEKDCESTSFRYEDNTSRKELGLPGKAFVGMINVNELIRLQNKYHRNQLYSENVRLYLGSRASVNKDIINTITSEESHWFPYMNNGISIICDNLEIGSPTNNKLPITLTNMQIINGCQTVNALYDAKYGESTKDDFKASKVLVKIYQIDPSQTNFRFAIIKATNNQNAVKLYSLVANDPLQVKIQEKLEILNYLYDRKGEGKQSSCDSSKIIKMQDAAVAYRAVVLLKARELRSGVAKSRIFKDEEYKHVFKNEYLEDENELIKFAVDLLIASIIVNKLRGLITQSKDKYVSDLPIIKKSLFYFGGYYYCKYKNEIDELKATLVSLIKENNPPRIKNDKSIENFENSIAKNFSSIIKVFTDLYNNLNEDKSDINNLLKSRTFENAFFGLKEIQEYIRNMDSAL